MFGLLLTSLVAGAADVSLETTDGVSLHATSSVADAAKRGVILVHMDGRSGEDWAYLSERLAKSGVSSIAPDLRGHGTSSGERDHEAMVYDVRAAADWLEQNGVEEIVCVGAEVGANLCLLAGRVDPRIRSAALLSPRLNPNGLNAPKAMQSWSDGNILAVASVDDMPGSKCVDLLSRIAGDRAEVVTLSEDGVGTQLLSRAPSLEGQLISWLSATTLSAASVGGIRPDTTDDTTVEAEGEKLRTHQ